MRRPRVLFSTLLTVVAACLAPATVRGAPDEPPERFDAVAPTLRKAFDAEKGADRLKAYQRAGRVVDARTIDLVLEGLAKEDVRAAAIAKAQAEAEASLEAGIADVEKLNAEHPVTQAQIEAFNKKARKVQARVDGANARLRDLSIEALQSKAIAGAAVAAVAAVVEAHPADAATGLLERLAATLAGPKATALDRLRRIDVLALVFVVPTGPTLREAAMATDGDVRVRTAALTAGVVRQEAGVVEDCVRLLDAPKEAWPLVAAAIDGLRRLHKREAIEPLIAFLSRGEIGRLREDGERALTSLTGQKLGPYGSSWAGWWNEAKGSFAMPEKPTDAVTLGAPEKGVTFYGITSFSDHVLFVLDVSGSMLVPAHPDASGKRAEERKIDLARKELQTALVMLDPAKTFDVIFFSHRVVRFLGAMTSATPPTVERTRRFAAELEPTGGTNIHDALEAAFAAAGVTSAVTTGKPTLLADTIFFMTDGTPTAGKMQDPERILAAVREWNRTARLTIHAIAVGDECDLKFLETLARENGGRFVHR
jgi:hypothetical protein